MLLHWKKTPFFNIRFCQSIDQNTDTLSSLCLCGLYWTAVTIPDMQGMNSMFPVLTVENQQQEMLISSLKVIVLVGYGSVFINMAFFKGGTWLKWESDELSIPSPSQLHSCPTNSCW